MSDDGEFYRRPVVAGVRQDYSRVLKRVGGGAVGYILKGDPPESERALDAIFHGNRFVSAGLTELR